jgi:putative oxidoreductase
MPNHVANPITNDIHLGTTLLRMTLGVVLIAHGLLKFLVFGMENAGKFFAAQGFPAWSVWPVTGIEIFCGLLMLVGFHSRYAALLAIPVLLGATKVHWPNGWVFSGPNGGWEYPMVLAMMAVCVACLGDGGFSLRTWRHNQAGR